MPTLFPTATADEDVEASEVMEVDLDATVEASEPDADINALVPQPPAGVYILKASLADRGESPNPYPSQTKKDHKPFVGVALKLEIVDEGGEFNGFELVDSINSIVQARRHTSALHHFMHCIGETLPPVIKIGELIDRVKTALESRPMVQAEIEWRAARKFGSGKYDWEDVARKMKDFPKDKESDGYSQIYLYKDAKSGRVTECRASAYISKYLPQS